MREKQTFEKNLYEQFARIGKALASPHRLELLNVLAQCERTVEALAKQTGQSIASTSQHLQVLRAAHLVEARREGTSMHYHLVSESVFMLWQAIRQVGEEQLPEIDRMMQSLLQNQNQMKPVEVGEVQHLLVNNQAILLDVRPVEEYAAGHLPHALSMPLSELEDHFEELPLEKEIIVYCRGSYCELAPEAVVLLHVHGYRARHFDHGIPEWRALALPVEV